MLNKTNKAVEKYLKEKYGYDNIIVSKTKAPHFTIRDTEEKFEGIPLYNNTILIHMNKFDRLKDKEKVSLVLVKGNEVLEIIPIDKLEEGKDFSFYNVFWYRKDEIKDME